MATKTKNEPAYDPKFVVVSPDCVRGSAGGFFPKSSVVLLSQLGDVFGHSALERGLIVPFDEFGGNPAEPIDKSGPPRVTGAGTTAKIDPPKGHEEKKTIQDATRKFEFDPARLQEYTLEQLNAMFLSLIPDGQPFKDKATAIAGLSRDFQK